jgi:SAM-dependent methyltransferase
MPQDNSRTVEANRAQAVSEVDSFTPARYRQFYAHFPSGAKQVLDVGCNTGRGGQVLKACDAALDITGLDCVPERVAALDRSVYRQVLCGFSTGIPVDDTSFDAVVGGEFIEHVPPAHVDGTLAEFFRVLRLKGRLLLTTPNPDYVKNRWRKLSVLLDKSHSSQHFPDCLAHRLRLVGFSNVRVLGSGRVSLYLGQRFPLLSFYGSYLVRGDKW